MDVTYFNPYPLHWDAHLVQSNHMEYFRRCGWKVHLVIPRDAGVEHLRKAHPWIDRITEIDTPKCAWRFRDLLYAYANFAESLAWLRVVGETPDIFFTHYIFTAPLVERLPASCRTIHVALDIMTEQFALTRGEGAAARKQFFRTLETRLYEMFDLNLLPTQELFQQAEASFYQPTLRFVPVYLDCLGERVQCAEDSCRYDLLFLGDDTAVHRQSLEWFYQHVYRLHLQPYRVRWAIAGPCAKNLGFSGRHLFPIAEPHADSYRATNIVVLPIGAGSGLPLPALQAMANGCALVTTPAGVRGMAGVEENVIKLDMEADPYAAASLIRDLLHSPDIRRELERKALAYMREHYGRDAFHGSMDEAMQSLGLGPMKRAA